MRAVMIVFDMERSGASWPPPSWTVAHNGLCKCMQRMYLACPPFSPINSPINNISVVPFWTYYNHRILKSVWVRLVVLIFFLLLTYCRGGGRGFWVHEGSEVERFGTSFFQIVPLRWSVEITLTKRSSNIFQLRFVIKTWLVLKRVLGVFALCLLLSF